MTIYFSLLKFQIDVEKAVKKKDEQISELRDRVKLLTEANDNLRNDLNESNKTEINLKKKIFEVKMIYLPEILNIGHSYVDGTAAF